MGPLDGIKVLDFTEIIAGPFGGMLLADMGADVIKVEPPWGEPWRLVQQFIPLESRTYMSLNRGKRSLSLDLTKPESLEVIHKLVAQTDIVLINYRPDVPYNLGIDYETLSAINPRLIYCENTAYGSQGPHSQRPGYDIIVQAMSGLLIRDGHLIDGIPQQPVLTAVVDYAVGLAIAWGVCGALYAREKTGKGQKIESSLLATSLALQGMRFFQVNEQDEEVRKRLVRDVKFLRSVGSPHSEVHARYEKFRDRPSLMVYYRVYQTSNSLIAVGCLSQTLRKKMALALGLNDLNYEESGPHSEALMKEAEALFLTRTTEDWICTLDAAKVPCGPVRFIEELMEDQQVLENGLVIELRHPTAGLVKMHGPLLHMSDTPLEVKTASPTLGQHNEEILEDLRK